MQRIDNFISALFRRLPMRTVFGLASMGLGFVNTIDPNGGVASVMIGVMGVHPTLHILTMGAMALSGAFLLIWRWETRRGPDILYALFLMYVVFVIVARGWQAGVNPSPATFWQFWKTFFVQMPFVWLIIREMTFQE